MLEPNPPTSTGFSPVANRQGFWTLLATYTLVVCMITIPMFVALMLVAVLIGWILRPSAGIGAGLHVWKWVAWAVLSSGILVAVRRAWTRRHTG